MSEEDGHHGWLHKLSQALLREPQDREQLVQLLRDVESREVVDAETLTMLEGVLLFSEMQVRDIMIPRTQMVAVEKDQSFNEVLAIVIDSGHSRFPTLGEKLDEVVGILHAKDLLKFISTQATEFDLLDIVRPPVFVPESKRLNILLKEFRANRNHMAIVIDEYGSIAGFVTIEDVIEQIVGDIEDEFDIDEEAFIKKHSETQYIVKAHTPMEDFNDYFQDSLDPQECDSIGGLVVKAFGYVPKRGETITLGNYSFTIINGTSRRIRLLRVVLNRA